MVKFVLLSRRGCAWVGRRIKVGGTGVRGQAVGVLGSGRRRGCEAGARAGGVRETGVRGRAA